MDVVKAEKRSTDVKAKRLRREGYVTGNICGKELESSIPVKMTQKEANHLLKKYHKGSRVVLDIDGETHHVLVKDIHYNALEKMVEEIEFQELVKNQKVHSVAEVVLINHEKVAEGAVQEQLEEVEYKAFPDDLIDKVEIDVGHMKVGDVIRVKDLDMAKKETIDLVTDPDTAVVTVAAVRREASEEEEAEE